MKTMIIALSLLMAATAAHASQDSTRFSCEPAAGLDNELGIERLAADLSNEDPEGVVTLLYNKEKASLVGNVDYESDANRYDLTPSNKALGEVTIRVFKKKGQWLARVISDANRNVSTLACEEL